MITKDQIKTTDSGILYDSNDYETARGVHVQFVEGDGATCDTVIVGRGLHRADELSVITDEQGCDRVTSGAWSVRI